MERLVGLVWDFAVRLLDRYLDSKIDTLKDDNARQTLRNVEDEVVRVLSEHAGPVVAKAIARNFSLRAVARNLPNDPTTGTWG